ncbi:hypothetical protein AB751O23_AY_00100, partial [Chlamydiales bacterium SCGC AB-751-O23]
MKIIGGEFKNRQLKTPKGFTSRPSTSMLREAVFNILQQDIEDCYFLDAFAGSGAMGLEALSRGAQFCTFSDTSRESINTIAHNLKQLAIPKDKFQLLKQ